MTNHLLRLGLLAVITMTPFTSPASAADFTYRRGVNISHWLSQNFAERPYAADWFDEEDVAWIAKQGFDHIRYPIDGRVWLREDGSIDESKLLPFDRALAWTKAHGMGTILDMHFLPGASFAPGSEDTAVFTDPALQQKVADFWRFVANRYAAEGPYLRFEILNEPIAKENAQLNPFQAAMIAAIRESNPTRVVYLTTNRWSSFDTIADLDLPKDPHIALTLHNYEPFVFTHQRASWGGMPPDMPAVPFPGVVPDLRGKIPNNRGIEEMSGRELTVAAMEERFDTVAAWIATHAPGIEVHVGEFGVYRPVDADSKRAW
ncbi:MAG: cellulase family glycosylhydrolase, partial [Opitutaceae bacterium]|nr:cellulase family glycosylhydrolase [Opitutaceae bacterium]